MHTTPIHPPPSVVRPRRRERNTTTLRDPATRDQIIATARKEGWRLLAARRGMERFQRRDSLSPTGAVDIAVEFNHRGELVSAWRSDRDHFFDTSIGGVEMVLGWLRESAI